MSRQVTIVGPSVPLSRAWRLMREQHIRHLPVVQARRLVGILSDRDVLLRATRDADGQIWVPNDPVETVMTPAPITCSMHTSVRWLAKTMIERHIDAVPVLRSDDELVGLVTSVDLMALLVGHEESVLLPFTFQLWQEGEVVASA